LAIADEIALGDPAMDDQTLAKARPPSAGGATRERPYRVLVVDDEPICLETTALVLAEDFEIVTAGSAEDAIARLAEGNFELIVTDHSMPGMTGTELFGRIQALGLPVGCVICTGDVRRVPASVGQEQGLVAVVEKPAEPQRLIRLVQQLGRLVDLRRSLAVVRTP
jgi:two-component system response regulator HupR/HoxA